MSPVVSGGDTCETLQCPCRRRLGASRRRHAPMSPTCNATRAPTGHLRDTWCQGVVSGKPKGGTRKLPLVSRLRLLRDTTRLPDADVSSEGTMCDTGAALLERARDTVRTCAGLRKTQHHQSVSYACPSRGPCVFRWVTAETRGKR